MRSVGVSFERSPPTTTRSRRTAVSCLVARSVVVAMFLISPSVDAFNDTLVSRVRHMVLAYFFCRLPPDRPNRLGQGARWVRAADLEVEVLTHAPPPSPPAPRT